MRTCLVAVLVLAACAQPPAPAAGEDTTSESSGDTSSSGGAVDGETSSSGSTGETSSDGVDGTDSSGITGAGDTSSSTGPGDACGDGKVDALDGEQCDDGKATKLCDDDCTYAACGDGHSNAAAGEECDDGNVENVDGCRSDCTLPICGDGFVWAGVEDCDDSNDLDDDACVACTAASCGDGFLQAGVEECDDGNVEAGDGCDECSVERWTHKGVAFNVAEDQLAGWTPCWTTTYEAKGELVSGIEAACKGDHLLLACRQKDSGKLSIAAHAPRTDMFISVDYKNGERHEANSVAWYWAPAQLIVGFAPANNVGACASADESYHMCWKTTGGGADAVFTSGGRCAAKLGFSIGEEPLWERVVYESWD